MIYQIKSKVIFEKVTRNICVGIFHDKKISQKGSHLFSCLLFSIDLGIFERSIFTTKFTKWLTVYPCLYCSPRLPPQATSNNLIHETDKIKPQQFSFLVCLVLFADFCNTKRLNCEFDLLLVNFRIWRISTDFSSSLIEFSRLFFFHLVL